MFFAASNAQKWTFFLNVQKKYQQTFVVMMKIVVFGSFFI